MSAINALAALYPTLIGVLLLGFGAGLLFVILVALGTTLFIGALYGLLALTSRSGPKHSV